MNFAPKLTVTYAGSQRTYICKSITNIECRDNRYHSCTGTETAEEQMLLLLLTGVAVTQQKPSTEDKQQAAWPKACFQSQLRRYSPPAHKVPLLDGTGW